MNIQRYDESKNSVFKFNDIQLEGGVQMKRVLSFVTVAGLAVLAIFVPDVMAQEAGEAGGQLGELAKLGLAIGSGLGIGIAAGIGGIGQGRATAAALSGIARNPGAASKIQTPMIIGLALIESLVIYALAITFLLQSKI
jgi:F-type H+-transporting ATPase subunit c